MFMILVADVYVYSLVEWLLWQSLLPCYKKQENGNFTKRLEMRLRQRKVKDKDKEPLFNVAF